MIICNIQNLKTFCPLISVCWRELYPMEFGNLKSKIKCFSLVENYYPMKFRYLKSLNLWFSKVENYYPMKFRNLKSWNLWISKVENYYPMKFRNLKSWNLWFSELEKFKKSKWEHCSGHVSMLQLPGASCPWYQQSRLYRYWSECA